jgi:hypothetical protein
MVIIGSLIAVFGVLVLCGAIALHWVNGKRDGDGYFTTGDAPLITDTYAITNDLDVHRGLISIIGKDGFSRVRLHVRSDRDAPIFVGVAPSHEASPYLSEFRHTSLTDFDLAPFRPQYSSDKGGDETPDRPAAQPFWTASATGQGRDATLDWDVESGPWELVLMNADGSEGVAATVNAGAQIPIIGQAAWAVTIAAAVILGFGVLLLLLGLRRRQQPSLPDGSAWGA